MLFHGTHRRVIGNKAPPKHRLTHILIIKLFNLLTCFLITDENNIVI